MTPELGKIVEGDTIDRDAVHVAIVSIVAGERLFPGQRAAVESNGKAYPQIEGDGVVDPFLGRGIFPGERFWLLLTPGTVTDLRHVWRHASIDGILPSDAIEIEGDEDEDPNEYDDDDKYCRGC